MNKISVDLWFDTNAEEAVSFYTSIFKDSKIHKTMYYGPDAPGPEGTVLYVTFELNGQLLGAINGGPMFKFNEAVSLVVNCETQDEIDYYWDKLSAVPESEQCGWVKDKFGVSWQITPNVLGDLMTDSDPERVNRVMQAMYAMKKLNIAALEKAAAG